MLDRFKIGTKLTVGFMFVLLLLIIIACVGYYALVASEKSTQSLLLIQGNRANLITIRQHLLRAQLQSAKGALYSDASYEKAREGIDAEIYKIAAELKEKMISKENQQDIVVLTDAYAKFVTEDTKFYSTGEAFTQFENKLLDAGRAADAQLRSSVASFVKAVNESKQGDGENEYVKNRFVQQILQLEHALTGLSDLRCAYYKMKSQAKLEDKKKEADTMLQAGEALVTGLKEFLKTVVDPNRQQEVKTAITAVEEWITDVKECVKCLITESEANVEQDRLSGTMADTAGTMMKRTEDLTKQTEEKMHTTDANVRYFMIAISVIAVIAGLIFSFVLNHNIGKGIKAVVEEIKYIANTGDLSEELPSSYYLARKDEVGELAYSIHMVLEEFRAVAKMAKALAEGDWRDEIKTRGDLDVMNKDLSIMLVQVNSVLHEIDESVKQVATGSGEVSGAAQSLSNGAQESAASLEEITASMQEISSQTKSNAENAGQARDLAHQASKAATEGQGAMQEMTSAMDRITKNSTEIQRVIKVIDDIAFQTNLLALNAAVEAARAGQHGKGFAVVAEEVRNLASRSAKAARETSELIAKSGHEIEKGGEVTTRTAEMLNTIVEQVKQTTEIVAGIAVASNEQAQGVNQVSIGLQQIDSVTQQNTAAAEESASAAAEMSSMAANLQKLVAQFKLRT